jgi:hypothetical protein
VSTVGCLGFRRARDSQLAGRTRRSTLPEVTAPTLLSAADLTAALEALAVELSAAGRPHELIVVGGAAVVLGYGAARTTRDIDVYEIDSDVRAAAHAVAAKLGLPDAWLSDGARAFMRAASRGKLLFERPSLTVFAVSTEQLLAMKLCAGRDEADWQDAALLLRTLEGDRDQVRLRIEPYWVAGKQKRGVDNFEDLWEELHGVA